MPVKKLNTILILMASGRLTATTSIVDSLAIRVDSNTVAKRMFAEDFSKKYQGEEFDYTSVEGEAQNFIARAINWFFNRLGELFGFKLSPEMYQIVELVVYIALGILVIYLVVRFLIGNSPNNVFSRKSAILNPLKITEEHIENIDLDKFIKEALNQKDYRLAIRYMYLKSLKQLSWSQLIEWHFDKTNKDYYSEISNESLKEHFRKVSYLYDYIWYGEFPLNESGYNSAKKDFDRLTNSITNAG